MLLFKQVHQEMILSGKKTQTRRLGRKRWLEGATHQARLSMFGQPFAELLIKRVRLELLGHISEEDARAEGYANVDEFLTVFAEINNQSRSAPSFLLQKVWVVDFAVVDRKAAA